MRLIYAFPEPLPLPRARGIQTAHTTVSLARLGVDVDLYYVPAKGHPTRDYGMEPPDTLQLHELSRTLFSRFTWPHSNRIFLWRLLRAIAGTPSVDVVMVRHLRLASMLVERLPQIPLVYESHEIFADTASSDSAAVRQAEEERVMRGAAAVVCTSEGTAARIVEKYGKPRRLEVIPNGVDRPEHLPSKDWTRTGQHIVYSGSLFPWKGAGDLVTAAAELSGCCIEMIGGEPHRVRELSAAASPAGADLVFSGHLSHSLAMERLGHACIAVLPNRAAVVSGFTSPIKLFEYMAAGCAIVATDLPAVREILDQDEAEWALPDDPGSLAAAIRRLISDPGRARAMGALLREKSLRYTWTARAENLRRVLEQASGDAPHGGLYGQVSRA